MSGSTIVVSFKNRCLSRLGFCFYIKNNFFYLAKNGNRQILHIFGRRRLAGLRESSASYKDYNLVYLSWSFLVDDEIGDLRLVFQMVNVFQIISLVLIIFHDLFVIKILIFCEPDMSNLVLGYLRCLLHIFDMSRLKLI